MVRELRALEELLKNQIGLDPISVGPQLILRAAKQRMRELRLHDLAAYECQVRESATELQELIEEVIVAESWFFRDERPFVWLREHVRQKWITAAARPLLRILSMPCAAGEEPYSIAIALLEEGLPARRFQIDAVDVSARRLAIARRGVYSQNAFRGPTAAYRTRYFREHLQEYEIDPGLREHIRFIQGSILDPRLLEGSSLYDVVFCRNLLIYMAPPARAVVLGLVDRVLTSEGVLLIGHADRLDNAEPGRGFEPIDALGCFVYRRKAQVELPVAPVSHVLDSQEPVLSRLPPPTLPAIEVCKPREISDTRVAAAAPKLSVDVDSRGADPSLLLGQASELANQGRFKEAIVLCERHLREKGLSAPAYCLMGMICQAAGERKRAEECLGKAVYLDPNHDEALLALALLAEHRDDQNAAAGFRRRAERTAALSRKRVN